MYTLVIRSLQAIVFSIFVLRGLLLHFFSFYTQVYIYIFILIYCILKFLTLYVNICSVDLKE